jgi:HD-GYP domain-containing protein (c-di-GMP phosphodiesterase class II)
MEKAKFKREYFRVDTYLPAKIGIVPPEMRENLTPKTEDIPDLKPMLLNLSGGGIAFRDLKGYKQGDVLEISIKFPIEFDSTVCLYGEVIRTQRTPNNIYHTFVKFTAISERIRNIITSHVFQWEREQMRNTMMYADTLFMPVYLHQLVPGTTLSFEIFVKDHRNYKYLFADGLPYDIAAKDYFEERNITELYIKKDDLPVLDAYIETSKRKVKKPEIFKKEDHMSFRKYSFNKTQHFPIEKSLLFPDSDINFSLFIMKDFNYSPIMDLLPEQTLTLDEKILSNAGQFLIKRTEIPLYCKYLASLSDSSDKLEEKKLMPVFIRENARIAVYDLLKDPANEEKLQTVIAVTNHIISYMLEDKNSLYSFISGNKADFYTHIHSVNTAVLCIIAGMLLNMDITVLKQLGLGAMLHDIGHSAINEEIIDKQGKLSDTEYENFKTHVIQGAAILKKYKNLPAEAMLPLLQHHEKLNGKGYPLMLNDKKISLFGRIAAIANSYDMLTTGRPYRDAYTSFNALSILSKEADSYDPNLFKIFVKLLSKV